MRNSKRLVPALALGLAIGAADVRSEANTKLSGAGWMMVGRVMEAWTKPNAINDYNGNFLGASGGILNASTTVNENWEAGMGLGSVLVHLARGSRAEANIWYPFWVGFLSEARLTYSTNGFADQGGFQLNLGNFGYNYNPDTKNLGLYLLRGYVYPGALVSGFGNLTGAQGRLKYGLWTGDLILNVETEDKPLYDLSAAHISTFRLHPSIELGMGVNFYRVLAANERATSPGKNCVESDLGPYANTGMDNACFHIRRDTLTGKTDTITGSLSGTKVMGRLRVDPKAWFGGAGGMDANDLVLYSEAAIIGTKDYPVLYDNILQRIPVMVGFNFPTFGFFDLSAEVEYYASKNSADNIGAQYGSWLPAKVSEDDVNPRRDDWKYSINASVMLNTNLKLEGVWANDHLRLGGSHNTATGLETLRTPKDYYISTKLAYFF